MSYALMFLFGVLSGAFLVVPIFLFLRGRDREIKVREQRLAAQATEAHERLESLQSRERSLIQREHDVSAHEEALKLRAVSYDELKHENSVLKRDLQNIDVNLNKLHLDVEVRQRRQTELDTRGVELGNRYLKENIKWIGSSLNANNFAACKQRLVDVVARCREIGFDVSNDDESKLISELRADFEKAVRAAFEREEQSRIKAQIREEEKVKREVEREINQAQREQQAIQTALEEALAKAKDEHGAEVQQLRAKLAAAEEKTQRAISQAQLTKAGHVYIISNIGSFGDGVFKIGMTRRLEPKDRVRELGDASVPFPFDVHMMISSKDAPSLENVLHRALHRRRLNKTNPRREFFKTEITEIRRIVEEHHGQVEYIADPEVLEYRQSMTMSEADSAYIEEVYRAVDEDLDATDNGT